MKSCFADSIRVAYNIPELSYAIVSADSIYEMKALGVKKVNTNRQAALDDRFRIGSNTKAITGLIAAESVRQGKLKWETKFFDLFPELKVSSRQAYYNLTLQQLLSFRANLIPYSYTSIMPKKEQFSGNDSLQRYEFAQWFLRQKPTIQKDSIFFTNLGFVAAGLMLEKVTGKSYEHLVMELGAQLGIKFGFGQPNNVDTFQVWGHDAKCRPEPPGDNYKLNWLLAAGNINVTLPDYIKFVQLQLKGLRGHSQLLTQEEFKFLHYGLKQFSIGWFWNVEKSGMCYSYNIGNPGTFLSKVYIFGSMNKAFIIFTNIQSDKAEEGVDLLLERLKKNSGIL